MKKESDLEHDFLEIKIPENAVDIFWQVIGFLQLFLSVTLAKRLVVAILLAIGMPVRNVMELMGLCEKSMWTLKKQLREKSVSDLMTIKSGSERRLYNRGMPDTLHPAKQGGIERTMALYIG